MSQIELWTKLLIFGSTLALAASAVTPTIMKGSAAALVLSVDGEGHCFTMPDHRALEKGQQLPSDLSVGCNGSAVARLFLLSTQEVIAVSAVGQIHLNAAREPNLIERLIEFFQTRTRERVVVLISMRPKDSENRALSAKNHITPSTRGILDL